MWFAWTQALLICKAVATASEQKERTPRNPRRPSYSADDLNRLFDLFTGNYPTADVRRVKGCPYTIELLHAVASE